jgi:hypothetical protein
MTCLGVPSVTTIFISLFSFLTSLHVLASISHPQVKYTQSFSEAIKAIEFKKIKKG